MIEIDKPHRVEKRKEKPTLDLLSSVDCEFTEGSNLVSLVPLVLSLRHGEYLVHIEIFIK